MGWIASDRAVLLACSHDGRKEGMKKKDDDVFNIIIKGISRFFASTLQLLCRAHESEEAEEMNRDEGGEVRRVLGVAKG